MESCSKCNSTGKFHYPNTGTWNCKPGGIYGQGFTWGLCDVCWGSGNSDKPFADQRLLKTLITTVLKSHLLLLEEIDRLKDLLDESNKSNS